MKRPLARIACTDLDGLRDYRPSLDAWRTTAPRVLHAIVAGILLGALVAIAAVLTY